MPDDTLCWLHCQLFVAILALEDELPQKIRTKCAWIVGHIHCRVTLAYYVSQH